jgi:hypothetical protein
MTVFRSNRRNVGRSASEFLPGAINAATTIGGDVDTVGLDGLWK